MTNTMFSKMTTMAVAALAIAVQAQAQNTTNTPNQPPANKRVIVVSLQDRKLALLEDGQVKKVYTVAVGKPSTPSPVGTFTIERRVANPVYHHNGKTIQPGPGNPVGTRWMGLSVHGYGIHGTNEPHSIGKAASHGCIRMSQADLEELFDMVAAGDTVELVGQRNEETVQLFANPVNPATPAASPALTLVAAVAPEPVHTSPTDKPVVTEQPAATALVLAEMR